MREFHDGQVAAAHAEAQGVPGRLGLVRVSFGPNLFPERPTTNGTQPHSSSVSDDAITRHADLATWLLEKETVAEADVPGLSTAANRVYQKLGRPLSRLVSPVGWQAILSRAVHLAQVDFPFLTGSAPGPSFEEATRRRDDVDPEEATRALVAVLKNLLDLLARFLGEDLTLRLVREVWPELPVSEPSRPGYSESQEAPS